MKTRPFLNTIRQSMRVCGERLRCEKTFTYWIEQSIVFQKTTKPPAQPQTLRPMPIGSYGRLNAQ